MFHPNGEHRWSTGHDSEAAVATIQINFAHLYDLLENWAAAICSLRHITTL